MIEQVLAKFPLEKQGILDLTDILTLVSEYHSIRHAIDTLKNKLQSLVALQLEYIEFLNGGKPSKFELETTLAARRLLGLANTTYISKDKFDSVPAVVRRRSTHSDVVELYKKIEEMSMRVNGGVTRGELIEEGLKIVGQTGEAKLAVLKHLKLIVIDRGGTIRLAGEGKVA